MRAQVTVVSAVLISGIIISLVGAAYLWGAPMVEKRTTVTEFQSAENFVEQLDETIISIANSGTGRKTFDIPFGVVKVHPFEGISVDSNTIFLEFIVNQPLMFNVSRIYLGGAGFEDVVSEVGDYGESRPSVMTLESERVSTGHNIIFRLHYRELDTDTAPKRGYVIALNKGEDFVTSGNNRLTVSFGGTETKSGAAANEGDLLVTYVDVEVS
jgi:hypothetical protein